MLPLLRLFRFAPLLFLFFVCQQVSAQDYNFLIRIPDANKEIHADNVVIDYRNTGGGQSNVRVGMDDIDYFGDYTEAVCNYDPQNIPGTLIDAGTNSGGAIVIKCSESDNICFSICSMIEGATPIVFQNDIYIFESETLIKGNYIEYSLNGSNLELKLSACTSEISDYIPPIMLPCDGFHTFCGDFAQIAVYGNSYMVTCYPSSNACVMVNIDANPNFHYN